MKEEFKYLLVAWDKVCSRIEVGGLGIRSGILIKFCWGNGCEVLGMKSEDTHLRHWVTASGEEGGG